MTFDIGQRWISHADLELGLGICVEVDSRRVTLLYPSAEEERTYALDRAPLTRYELKAGDKLTHIDGRVLDGHRGLSAWKYTELRSSGT
jgi:ATP-dependent helicase HepA